MRGYSAKIDRPSNPIPFSTLSLSTTIKPLSKV